MMQHCANIRSKTIRDTKSTSTCATFRNGATSTDTTLVKTLVLYTVVHTGKGGKIHLSKDKVSTGYFHLVLTSIEAGRTLGFTEYNFSVFDSKSNAVPEADVNYIAASTVKPGAEITWYSSGKKDNYTIYKVMYNDGSEGRKVSHQHLHDQGGATEKVGFYQVTRDTGAEFFVEMLPRGIAEFTYDLVVAQGGTFHNAPATVQSMYKPGLAAYSDVSQIKVK